MIEVSEIRGKYPVYKIGDKIVIDGPEIVLEKTERKECCIYSVCRSQRALYRRWNSYL